MPINNHVVSLGSHHHSRVTNYSPPFFSVLRTYNLRGRHIKIGRSICEHAQKLDDEDVFGSGRHRDTATTLCMSIVCLFYSLFQRLYLSLISYTRAPVNDRRSSWSPENFSTLKGSMKTQRIWSSTQMNFLGCQELLCSRRLNVIVTSIYPA